MDKSRSKLVRPATRGSALVALVALFALALAGQAWAKGPPATECEGPFGGEAQNILVPEGKTCTLEGTAVVVQSVTVAKGASLIDEGASIGQDLKANNPAGIRIGAAKQSTIGHDVKISGLTGSIGGKDNTVCNAKIGHDLHLEHSAATAAALVVGDPPDCTAGDTVGHDIHVQENDNHVDVSDSGATHDIHVQNNTAGVVVENTSSGHDLHVQNNSGGTVVSNNTTGHNAKCSGNKPATTGENNTQAKGRSKDCPAPPLPPTVKHVDPNKGPTAGGTTVKITGSGLTGTEKVMFGATEAAIVKVVSDKEVIVTSPAAAEGQVDVTVTTKVGTSKTGDGDRFNYTNKK